MEEDGIEKNFPFFVPILQKKLVKLVRENYFRFENPQNSWYKTIWFQTDS